MYLSRSRAYGLATAVSITLVAGLTVPTLAAESPEAAVDRLFDAVESGDFSSLDDLVCEAERAAVREMLDPSEAMGMSGGEQLLTFVVEDRAITVITQDAEEATVNVAGTLSMNVAEDEVEELARALIEADMGELSDEDLEVMLPFVEMALNQTMPLDEELTIVVEDGEWVVCGGLGEPVDEPDYGFEPTVSSTGLCGLVSPEEMSAVGALEYDSSSGFETFCNYSTSDYDRFHQTGVSVELDSTGEYAAEAYGADQQLEVGGAQAWAPGPDGWGTNLIVQAGPDVLTVTVGAPEAAPEGFDWLTQATAIAELFMPRLAEARVDLAGPAPEPTPEPTPEVPLCDSAWMDELNELTGLGFDEITTDSSSCQLMSVEGEPGFHFVIAFSNEATLEQYETWIGDHEESTVAGMPALVTERQTVIALPDGSHVLDVTVSLDSGDEDLSVTSAEVTALLTERILARAPTMATGPALTEESTPDVSARADNDPAGSLCETVSLDELNDVAGLGLDGLNGAADTCELLSSGQNHYIFAGHWEGSLDFYRSLGEYEDSTVAGLPAVLGERWLAVELPGGTHVLDISVALDAGAADLDLTAAEVAVLVAEQMLPGLTD